MQFLAAEHITKTFDGVTALNDVSFDINVGEIHGLVGENGCGKSTLMKIIAGVLDFHRGTLRINGRQMDKYSAIEAVKQGIGIIYQDLSLFPNLTVLENIYISQMVNDNQSLVFSSAYKDKVGTIIQQLGISLDLEADVDDLPIAKQQLVAIARALINDSRLIILDEPTTALTRTEIKHLFTILNRLRTQGISFIFISHKLNELLEICDRITVMRDGKLIDTVDGGEATTAKIEALMLGYELTYPPRQTHATDEVLLRVRGLCKKNSFQDISFDLHKGEVLGIAGLLGAGRTELALALFGIEPAQSGEIFIENRPVTIGSVGTAVANGIAYVPEDRLLQGLVMQQSIAANAALCSLKSYLNPLGLLDGGKMRRAVSGLLKGMQVKYDNMDKEIRMLSGGNQQKVVLAKWLATHPRIFILDSPTVGIDVGAKSYIYQTVKEKAAEGMGIVFISDELPELLANCDRIIMMNRGRFGKEYATDAIDNETLQQEMENV
ncbi:sugar ABC transporter ATP-binding protein [Sodalis ligni]|uniref:Simple sugar transport system ATP-binding protein n=1 Tax=Sodalis ligni TaxID=2697027 RepID=A0A4R1NAA3_9GAMM|nr:sugar ABC transporter ATP-binding protein [Sodalis ligni]TCL04334.1 simple sugar transport system ATP-binding protein [Sodalis ligni]